ncbi:MAG: glycerate kinase type-2 family protein [Rhodospirillaceae bacterium]
MRAALAAADAGACVARGLPAVEQAVAEAARWNLIAAGKAALPMAQACLAGVSRPPALALAVAPGAAAGLPGGVEFIAGGHPVPTPGSVAAGARALDIAGATQAGDLLVVLLSGGASALLECPADGVALADLQATTSRLLRAGADITALNAVRKHLSRVKGGRLASAAAGRTVALVVSDVVGDDLAVIASGPTVPDPTTYADALAVLERFGGAGAYPPAVVGALRDGLRGARPETPKAGSAGLARASTIIVGAQRDALEGARQAAAARGYDVHMHPVPVTGEAREAAQSLMVRIRAGAAAATSKTCLLSGGETTVTVTGSGKGGRNQELALALVGPLADVPAAVVVASVGTDGIDGPTDAAGAVVDTTTAGRARAAGVGDPEAFLRDNDAYAFFRELGDLVITGPTGTNVCDLQIVMIRGKERP